MKESTVERERPAAIAASVKWQCRGAKACEVEVARDGVWTGTAMLQLAEQADHWNAADSGRVLVQKAALQTASLRRPCLTRRRSVLDTKEVVAVSGDEGGAD